MMTPTYTIFAATLLIPWIATTAEPRAVLETDQVPQKAETLVWSPLFQASWDKMNARHAGKPTKVVPPNPVIDKLNQFQWEEKKVMPDGGYAVFAGPNTEEFARQTAKEIKKRFNYEIRTDLLDYNANAYAYYGVLVRDLNFKKKFFRSKKKALHFKDSKGDTHKVSFFGTARENSEGYRKNVQILSNNPVTGSFVMAINTDKVTEKIILYRPDKTISFDQAIKNVLESKKSPLNGDYGQPTYAYLMDGDIVKIPYIKINSRTDFTSLLKGKRYYEGEAGWWFTSGAYQITKFDLTEKGAKIRVETGMDDAFGGKLKPRQFICDRPFFVFAWRDEAPLPYFATWIDGKEALSPFKPSK